MEKKAMWAVIGAVVILIVAFAFYFNVPEKADNSAEAAGYIDVSVAEAKVLIDNDPDLTVIDVSPYYEQGHIPGAVWYELGDGTLDWAIDFLNVNASYLVYCHGDAPSMEAARKLVDNGFKTVYRLEGNFAAWEQAGGEVHF